MGVTILLTSYIMFLYCHLILSLASMVLSLLYDQYETQEVACLVLILQKRKGRFCNLYIGCYMQFWYYTRCVVNINPPVALACLVLILQKRKGRFCNLYIGCYMQFWYYTRCVVNINPSVLRGRVQKAAVKMNTVYSYIFIVCTCILFI